MIARRAVAQLALAVLAPGVAGAQLPQIVPPDAAVARGRDVTVRLMTMGQGDAIWERFGHNALWIADRLQGQDIAYNWGIFDFNEPGFLFRFLTGDTRYWMAGFDARLTLEAYQERNRTVLADPLVMSAKQRGDLDTFVRWNSLGENRFYTYDYFLDNCSTRLRDVLDRALGGAIRAQTDTVRSGMTFRRHTQRMLEGQPLAYAGITIALGQPADREISVWEEMFLPGKLQQHLRRIQVDTGDGRLQPLVPASNALFTASREAEPAAAANATPWFLGAGIAIGTVLLLAGHFARPVFAILAATWLVVSGVIGVILMLAWGFTRHIFWYRNENLFSLHPMLLVLAVMLPLAMRARASVAMQRRAAYVAIAVAGVGLLGALLKALPFFYQRNWDVLFLVLPVHVAVAAMTWKRYRAF